MKQRITSDSSDQTMQIAAQFAAGLNGGETIELVSDVGGGKTTFVKGLARGLGVDEVIQSPTFTISRVYSTSNGEQLCHYDFYRLQEPGIMAVEIAESIADPHTITVIEWAESVASILPTERYRIHLRANDENSRVIEIESLGE